MKKCSYKILYDLKKDTKNWLSAVDESEFEEKKWQDGLYGYYLEEFNKVSKMSASNAKKELRTFILTHFKNDIRKKQFEVEKEYSRNFLNACEYVEKVTDRPLAIKSVKVYLTTFPRAPYSIKEKTIYFCIFWDDAISTFLHELLHMQVIKYWRNNKRNEISKLSEKDFVYLNESLTFLVNGFTNKKLDVGYKKHSAFRDELKEYWDKGCSFEELLLFGAMHIQDYSKI